jgi:hypothetical protein
MTKVGRRWRSSLFYKRSGTMQQRALGSKLWMIVQSICVCYAGQQLYGVMRKQVKRKRQELESRKKESDRVDTALEDSFPASDPPASCGSHAVVPVQ